MLRYIASKRHRIVKIPKKDVRKNTDKNVWKHTYGNQRRKDEKTACPWPLAGWAARVPALKPKMPFAAGWPGACGLPVSQPDNITKRMVRKRRRKIRTEKTLEMTYGKYTDKDAD